MIPDGDIYNQEVETITRPRCSVRGIKGPRGARAGVVKKGGYSDGRENRHMSIRGMKRVPVQSSPVCEHAQMQMHSQVEMLKGAEGAVRKDLRFKGRVEPSRHAFVVVVVVKRCYVQCTRI